MTPPARREEDVKALARRIIETCEEADDTFAPPEYRLAREVARLSGERDAFAEKVALDAFERWQLGREPFRKCVLRALSAGADGEVEE